MKLLMSGAFPLLWVLSGQPGDAYTGEPFSRIPFVYGTAAVIALLLLVGYIRMVRPKNGWFVLLFSSVLVVNVGYTLLSVSTGLEMALWANRLSYLGSVFLPLAMLMSILQVTGTGYSKKLCYALLLLSAVVFLIAASPGILDLYYKEVSFAVVNGTSVLVKVYGPLHPLYLFYLLGYFGAMAAVIVRASVKRTLDSPAHAVILAIAVLVNIGVWLMEQLSTMDFEFLSVSYIISELFLLGVNAMVNENQRLKTLLREKEAALQAKNAAQKPHNAMSISADMVECFIQGMKVLTVTERAVLEAHLAGKTTKEILTELNIKENTLKFHNKNLYGKLGVSSRKQLLAVYQASQAHRKSTDFSPTSEKI